LLYVGDVGAMLITAFRIFGVYDISLVGILCDNDARMTRAGISGAQGS
jgi:hypothetical protein